MMIRFTHYVHADSSGMTVTPPCAMTREEFDARLSPSDVKMPATVPLRPNGRGDDMPPRRPE